MNVMVCVDDDYGMLFNHRRQSSDQKLIERIKVIAKQRLWITEFSSKLFDCDIKTDQNMLGKAESDDFCFVENLRLMPYLDKINKLYVFHWNRKYPSDFKLDLNLAKDFVLEKTEDFVGKSHEKITMEVYSHA